MSKYKSQKRFVKVRAVSLSPNVDEALNDKMKDETKEGYRRVGRSEIVNRILSKALLGK